MENVDTGKDKIRKICDILKNETIKPAQEEAQKILEVAEQEARNMIRDAEEQASQIIATAKAKVNKERELFEHSIQEACRLATESLKQEIEERLFNSELGLWLSKQTSDPEVVAKLINTIVQAIEKEGTSANFSAVIPSQLPPEKVNALLLQDVVDKLREKGTILGKLSGGAQIVLHDKNMTLDLSDTALKELLAPYLRKDFREILFK